MKDQTERKLLRLPSVGLWIDTKSHELYPEMDSGNPDFEAFLPNRLSDLLNDPDFKESLSIEDAKRLNRNLEFVGGGDE